MGNEISQMSCTMPRKIPTLEESLEAVCDGVEHVADRVEAAWDDATAQPPAKPSCALSDEEKLAAHRWLHELVQQQNRASQGGAPCVYEDVTMARFLESIGLLSLSTATTGKFPGAVPVEGMSARDGIEGSRDEPKTEAMLSRLHSIPIGHWLVADPGRKGYHIEEVRAHGER